MRWSSPLRHGVQCPQARPRGICFAVKKLDKVPRRRLLERRQLRRWSLAAVGAHSWTRRVTLFRDRKAAGDNGGGGAADTCRDVQARVYRSRQNGGVHRERSGQIRHLASVQDSHRCSYQSESTWRLRILRRPSPLRQSSCCVSSLSLSLVGSSNGNVNNGIFGPPDENVVDVHRVKFQLLWKRCESVSFTFAMNYIFAAPSLPRCVMITGFSLAVGTTLLFNTEQLKIFYKCTSIAVLALPQGFGFAHDEMEAVASSFSCCHWLVQVNWVENGN